MSIIKFRKVAALFPNRKVRTVRTEKTVTDPMQITVLVTGVLRLLDQV